MNNFIFKSSGQIKIQLSFFFLLNIFALHLKAANQNMTYSCDVKDSKNLAAQISLEVYSDHVVALETTKTEKKSFRILRTETEFSKIKEQAQDDKIHSWYSLVVLNGDYKANDEFPASKNNQEVALIYLSHPKKDKKNPEIYINRLFYSQEKSESVDFRGSCKQTKP